jgi:hypothetical protein
VYKPKDPIPAAAITPVSLYYSEPSADATKKAFGIWYFRPSPTAPGTLIVAVRGTKLRLDHSVNLNGDGEDVGHFIVCAKSTGFDIFIRLTLTWRPPAATMPTRLSQRMPASSTGLKL